MANLVIGLMSFAIAYILSLLNSLLSNGDFTVIFSPNPRLSKPVNYIKSKDFNLVDTYLLYL